MDIRKLSRQEVLELTDEQLARFSYEELKIVEQIMSFAVDDCYIVQWSLKTMMNSLYGALGNKHFFIKNPDFAAAVTATGRFFIQLCADRIEKHLQALIPSEIPYVIYGDTDSVYYNIENFVIQKFGKSRGFPDDELTKVTDWANDFEQKIIQEILNQTIQEFAELLNVYDPKVIGVEREIIADAGAFVAKKKYFTRVQDIEGVRFSMNDPYIKVMGLEIAKSSSPEWVKKRLKEAIPKILDSSETEFLQWVDQVRKEFGTLPASEICSYQGVNNLNYKLTDKGIPQGSRSAIMHNVWVEKQGLEGEIPFLEAGEKYKRCYLLEPNQFGTEVLSFESDKISEIIEQDGIYDYSRNFKLLFEQPLQRMVEQLGYDITGKPRFGNLDLSGDW